MQRWPASVPAQHACAAPGLCPEGVTWLMGMFPRGAHSRPRGAAHLPMFTI